jgi:hypothetical protein
MLKEIFNAFNEITKDPNHRYKSWEHCYTYFKTNRYLSHKDIDVFSLHLFAYLSSWGMLRGSSFLLQKDYKFHREIVEIILNPKYDLLQDINLAIIDSKQIELIIELGKEIRKSFYDRTYLVNGKKDANKIATDTLVSKVLLGTLCCAPAYDRFFKDGLKLKGIPNRKLNKKAFLSQKKYYNDHLTEFLDTQNAINKAAGIDYPSMKIFDMYMWELGYEN